MSGQGQLQLPDSDEEIDPPKVQLGFCRPRNLRATIADRIESEMRGVDPEELSSTPLGEDVEGIQLALRNLNEKRADNIPPHVQNVDTKLAAKTRHTAAQYFYPDHVSIIFEMPCDFIHRISIQSTSFFHFFFHKCIRSVERARPAGMKPHRPMSTGLPIGRYMLTLAWILVVYGIALCVAEDFLHPSIVAELEHTAPTADAPGRHLLLTALWKDRSVSPLSLHDTLSTGGAFMVDQKLRTSAAPAPGASLFRPRATSTVPVDLVAPWRGASVALVPLQVPWYRSQVNADASILAPQDDLATKVRDGGFFRGAHSSPFVVEPSSSSEQSRGHPLPFHLRDEASIREDLMMEQRWPRVLLLDAPAWSALRVAYQEVYTEYVVMLFTEWTFRAEEVLRELSRFAEELDLYRSDTAVFEFSSKTKVLPGPIVAPQTGAFARLWGCYSGIATSAGCNMSHAKQRVSAVVLPPARTLQGSNPSPGVVPFTHILQLVTAAPSHLLPNGTLPADVEAAPRSSGVYFVSSSPLASSAFKSKLEKNAAHNRGDDAVPWQHSSLKWVPLDDSSVGQERPGMTPAGQQRRSSISRFVLRYTRSSVYVPDEEVVWERLLVDYDVVALLVPPPAVMCPSRNLLHIQQTFHRLTPALQQWSDSLYAYTQAIREVVPFFVFLSPTENTTGRSSVSAPCQPPSWASVLDAPELSSTDGGTSSKAAFTAVEDLGPPIDLKEMETVSLKTKSRLHLSNLGSGTDWTLTLLSRVEDEKSRRAVKQDILVPGLGPPGAAINPQLFAPVGTVLVDTLHDLLSDWPVREVLGSTFESTLRRLLYPVTTRKQNPIFPQGATVKEIIVVADPVEDTVEDTVDPPRCGAATKKLVLASLKHRRRPHRRHLYLPPNSAQFAAELHYAAEEALPTSPDPGAPEPFCTRAARPEGLPAGCAAYCITREERLFRLPFGPPAERLAKEEAAETLPLAHPSAAELHRGLEEIKNVLGDTKRGKLTQAGLSSTIQQTPGLAPWSVWIPDGKAVPVVQYRHTASVSVSSITGPNFALLYDGSCGLSSNYIKSIRLVERCYPDADFYLLDVSAVQRAPSWAAGTEALRRSSGGLEPLLFPHYLGDVSLLQPPRLVLANGTHAVTTLSTVAYVENDRWVASVLDLLQLVDSRPEAVDAVWECIDALIKEDTQRRLPFRAALWGGTNATS
eukprot:gene12043-8295_t